jgi:hypothetical protein
MFEGFPNFGTEQAGAYMRFLFSLHHLGNKWNISWVIVNQVGGSSCSW